MSIRIVGISFSTGRDPAVIAVGAPPSGVHETSSWRLPGKDVVRAAAGFSLDLLQSTHAVQLLLTLTAKRQPRRRTWISARSLTSTTLGDIAAVAIDPDAWHQRQCEIAIDLDAAALRRHGVTEYHVAWEWAVRQEPSAVDAPLGLSEHLIYVTVSSPMPPWTGTGMRSGSRTPPWLAPLSLASKWACGATSTSEVAQRITRSIFNLGQAEGGIPLVTYYPDAATYLDPGLAGPRWLDLELFLEHLRLREPDMTINCYEAAVLVVTFANLLGCQLVPCAIETNCDLFALNSTEPLGFPTAIPPEEFQFHVVASQRTGRPTPADDLIFDASLKIDQDSNPSTRPFDFVLANPMLLGDHTSRPGSGTYLPQLIAAGALSKARAEAVQIPWVGEQPAQHDVEICPVVRYVRYLWRIQRNGMITGTLTADAARLSIDGFDRQIIFADQAGIRREGLPRRPRASRAFFRSNADTGETIRLDLWVDDDPWITMSFLAELLATGQVPAREVDIPGGKGYSVSGATTIFVLYRGAILQLTSVGRTRVNAVSAYRMLLRMA